MIDDVFCKIISGEIKDSVVMEGEDWIAINDIHPATPVHVLIVPKRHITSLVEIKNSDEQLLGRLILAANKVAEKFGLFEKGYRLIVNCGEHGGQLVPHLHIHLLGGKRLGAKIVQDPKLENSK